MQFVRLGKTNSNPLLIYRLFISNPKLMFPPKCIHSRQLMKFVGI